ncbi:MAG: serine/threonine protein kinase [Cyanobacteria bacterium SZAS-4]|nr:serine/threonine protein kinase [Cyanobacteria bacterium SZAS-4]
MTDTDIARIQKYPVIIPKPLASSDSAGPFYVIVASTVLILWMAYCYSADFQPVWQFTIMLMTLGLTQWKNLTTNSLNRSRLDLKAKGLDIKDHYLTALMPWDWLTNVEIRQRTLSIFPNYVYFKFRNHQDVLILWDDIKETMDSTTLISCVRTWAPRAEIIGDAKLTKSESIATYTEIWLKDMSSTKSGKRIRADQTLAPGTILSDSYKIDRVLSGGGQGTAYMATVLATAEVSNLPPQIVVKEFILPSNERGLKKATESLVKEVSIMRRISSPLIIRLFDFFMEDARGYLIVEFIDGINLRQLVDRNGPLDEKKTAQIGVMLCEALTYLHALEPAVVHGDVTPDNVMLKDDGTIKLMDFDAAAELTRNKTNTVVGKHAYMSPEQFKGELGDSCDMYALGCTLNFLLTGSDPEPVSESHPAHTVNSVSQPMNEIVSTATKFDVTKRFPSLQEMRQQLERI